MSQSRHLRNAAERHPEASRIGPGVRLAGAAALALVAVDAQAYLDPGTGSMLIQAALAVIVGAGLYFRALRDKIKTFFSAVFHRKKDAVEPDDA